MFCIAVTKWLRSSRCIVSNMRRGIFIAIGTTALLLILGCSVKKEANTATAAAELLRTHIVSKQRMVITDTNGAEIVWSDGVIVEITGSLPAPIQSLASRTQYHTDIRSTIKRVEADLQTEYRPGRQREKSSREGYVEFEGDKPEIHALLNPVYVAYVEARYPECSTLLKGKYDPVVFTVKGEIRALIMPFKLPNE